jgi:hypothetical protein
VQGLGPTELGHSDCAHESLPTRRGVGWCGPGQGRADELRLEAEDVGWTHGSGQVVRGPYGALLLALGGRSAGLAHLSGDGVNPRPAFCTESWTGAGGQRLSA